MYRPVIAVLLFTACWFAVPGCENAKPSAVTAVTATARQRGSEAAQADLAVGMLKRKEYPPLPYSLEEMKFIKLLSSECGVVNEVVPGPIDSAAMREEVAGYNEVMHAEIARRFGADIFDKLRAKAKE